MQETKIIPIQIGSCTLVGFMQDTFPIKGGNCFDLIVDGRSYYVINMRHENFEHITKQLNLKDIEVEIFHEPEDKRRGSLFVRDDRIPSDYLQNKSCSICLGLDRANEINQHLGVTEEKERQFLESVDSCDDKKLILGWKIKEEIGLALLIIRRLRC